MFGLYILGAVATFALLGGLNAQPNSGARTALLILQGFILFLLIWGALNL